MGGKPLTAMNVVCFPSTTMDMSLLRAILEGGLATLREAHVVLIGGHSVEDAELKYGLSVTGTIHPDDVLAKGTAQPGDKLILTKPLGTGIINTAIKAQMASETAVAHVTQSMITLNKTASEIMQNMGVTACTDITGFGLLGHACEMLRGGTVGMVMHAASIPRFHEAEQYARKGLVPGGTQRNKNFRAHQIECAPTLPAETSDILFDPQTSGGLLIAVAEAKATRLLEKLKEAGIKEAAIIGDVVSGNKGKIVVN